MTGGRSYFLWRRGRFKAAFLLSVLLVVATICVNYFLASQALVSPFVFQRLRIILRDSLSKASNVRTSANNDGTGKPTSSPIRFLSGSGSVLSFSNQSDAAVSSAVVNKDNNSPHARPKGKPLTIDDNLLHSILHWSGAPLRKGYPQWQVLDGVFDAFIYTAHFDDVDFPPIIRIVGFARVNKSYSQVSCYLYYSPDATSRQRVSGRLYHFRGKNGFEYIGAFVDCPVPGWESGTLPYAVSVSKGNDTAVTNYMIVHYSYNAPEFYRQGFSWSANTSHTGGEPTTGDNSKDDRGQQREHQQPPKVWKWNVTRCVPAIQMGFNKHLFLAEMVSASLAMGVEHFVFYVQRAGPNVLRLLQVLEEQGIAEVHPWNLRMPDRNSVFYVAEFSAIQECLYRHLRSSRFLLFGDLDELFVPRTQRTLLPLLSELFEKTPTCGAYLFRNAFFDTNLPDRLPPSKVDPAKFFRPHVDSIMTHVIREAVPWKAFARTKVAADPHKVFYVGIHDVRGFRPGFGHCIMDPEVGLLQHYRHLGQPLQNAVTDTYLYRYARDIIREVKKLLRHYNSTVRKPYP